MTLIAGRIFHPGTRDKHCEHLGTACKADFEGCETPFMCSANRPFCLSTMYCGWEKALIYQELDLWNQFFSLIYISRTLTLRDLWHCMRSQLTCKILWVWSLSVDYLLLNPEVFPHCVGVFQDVSVSKKRKRHLVCWNIIYVRFEKVVMA